MDGNIPRTDAPGTTPTPHGRAWATSQAAGGRVKRWAIHANHGEGGSTGTATASEGPHIRPE